MHCGKSTPRRLLLAQIPKSQLNRQIRCWQRTLLQNHRCVETLQFPGFILILHAVFMVKQRRSCFNSENLGLSCDGSGGSNQSKQPLKLEIFTGSRKKKISVNECRLTNELQNSTGGANVQLQFCSLVRQHPPTLLRAAKIVQKSRAIKSFHHVIRVLNQTSPVHALNEPQNVEDPDVFTAGRSRSVGFRSLMSSFYKTERASVSTTVSRFNTTFWYLMEKNATIVRLLKSHSNQVTANCC